MARGDIVLINLPELISAGHEQTGSRPALIVHDDSTSNMLSVIMIIPFTSNLNAQKFPYTFIIQPSHQNGLYVESALLVFQLRAVDKRRIIRKMGNLETETLEIVNQELKHLLGLS